ncbi:MAG: hypothetical protein HYV06_04120 [Deltaproteobacteria bacterium]|nr:hypothetical protein [Deltaproteobacteria bacterium]
MPEPQPVDMNAMWHEHCLKAVRKFVMNAVVVDNQPVLNNKLVARVAAAVDEGMGEPVTEEVADKPMADTINDHELNIQKVSDAFAEQDIACAFVFPDDRETDDELKHKRIIAAAVPSDIVILDWFLKDGDSSLTKRALKSIAERDSSEKGRMRLICIYTGQPDIVEVTRDAIRALREGGLDFCEVNEAEGTAKGNHHSLLVLNKQAVTGVELPRKILEAFTGLADGLLPSFALAAVAAVRRNMHHIISRFPSSLDDSFVANLLITDPPEDVTELIRELFISECDTALGLERVADDYLNKKRINDWLIVKKKPDKVEEYELDNKEKTKIKINKDFVLALLEHGLTEDKVRFFDGMLHDFKDKKRNKVSQALHGGKAKAKEGEGQFARFVSLKRDTSATTKFTEEWKPSLTLGTIVRNLSSKKYFYCITPACDTIRLKGKKRSFVMIALEKPEGKPSLLVPVKGGVEKFKINTKPYCVRTFEFSGDESNGRIMAQLITDEEQKKTFIFEASGIGKGKTIKFEWLGEVRRNRANRDMAELNREWLRLGIKDSEYLRLAAKGYAEL